MVEMFEADPQAVKANRSAGFRRSKDAIIQARDSKRDQS